MDEKLSEIQILQNRIIELENENDILSSQAEEWLMLNKIFEILIQYKSSDKQLPKIFETISILMSIDIIGYFYKTDTLLDSLCVYDISKEDSNISLFIEIPKKKLHATQTTIVSKKDAAILYLNKNIEFNTLICIPIQSQNTKSTYIVVVTKENDNKLHFIKTLEKIVAIIALNLDKEFYIKQIHKFNKHLESSILERTKELVEQNTELQKVNEMYNISNANLTETKQKLEINEKRLSLALKATKDAIWDWNITTGKTYYSERWYEMLGYEYNEIEMTFEGWKNLCHPDDYEETIRRINVTLFSEKSTSYYAEFRMKTKSNQWIWVLGRGNVVERDADGKPIILSGTNTDISQQKQIEQALKQEQGRYNAFVNSTHDFVFVIDNDCKYVLVNKAFCEFAQKNEEQIIGKTIFEILPDEVAASCHKSHIETLEKQTNIIYKEHLPHISLEVSKFPVPISEGEIGVGAIVRNITKQERNEEKIRILSRAIEQSPSMVLITDTNGFITYSNPKFTEITGYKFIDIVGQKASILKSPKQELNHYTELWETIESGKEWRGEFLNCKKNGEEYWEFTSISPVFNLDGKITNYISIREDITERKKNEIDLLEAKEKAEESNRFKIAFLQNFSHNVRTPLNAICGFSELLTDEGNSKEDIIHYTQIIQENSNQLLELVTEIITISLLDSNQEQVNISTVDVYHFMNALYNTNKEKACTKKLTCTFVPLEDKSLKISTDKSKLSQILQIILNNAIKFTDTGNIELGYTINDTTPNTITFFIKDSGVGIETENLQKIFEKFSSINTSANRLQSGTQLGLAIAKSLTSLLKGSIEVKSKINEGSTFYINLPIF